MKIQTLDHVLLGATITGVGEVYVVSEAKGRELIEHGGGREVTEGIALVIPEPVLSPDHRVIGEAVVGEPLYGPGAPSAETNSGRKRK